MIRAIWWCVKVGLAAIMALVPLSLFTLLYWNSGVHISNETGATDYKWEPYQYKSTMQEGFSWMRVNADGFNNLFDLNEDTQVDVLLMGSSHMEAVYMNPAKNTGSLLNELIPNLVTYNIGVPGHTIYHCVSNLEAAINCYNPSKYIIIETDQIVLDEELMKSVIEHRLDRIPSHDRGLIYIVQKFILCFQPLYRQMGNWISASDLNKHDTTSVIVTDLPETTYDSAYVDLLDQFINEIAINATDKKVIIVYHPETGIDENGEMTENDGEAVMLFQKICNIHGITFIDMYTEFEDYYTREHRLAHGFSNTAVGYGHLNETGHSLIAQRLATEIEDFKYVVK